MPSSPQSGLQDPADASQAAPKLGRYTLHDVIASGGMASVHLGRLRGSVGFSRVVAVKRIHPHIAREPDFVAMFLDEARLASRVRHPNVVSVLDVAATSAEVFLVMEYIVGESLAVLSRKQAAAGDRIPLPFAVHALCDVLHGLHAAHEATDPHGEPLGIVHRDVSPHNILVGTDGVARILDFGVAKAAGRLYTTRSGELKGKLGYMAPEQIRGERVARTADVYSAGVTLWELLVGRRMIEGDSEAELVLKSLSEDVPSPHQVAPDVPEDLSRVVSRAIARDPRERYPTALAFLEALEGTVERVSPRQVGEWVKRAAATELSARAALVTRVETGPLTPSDSVAPAAAARPLPAEPRSGRGLAFALGAGSLATVVAAAWLASRPPAEAVPSKAPAATQSAAAPVLPSPAVSAPPVAVVLQPAPEPMKQANLADAGVLRLQRVTAMPAPSSGTSSASSKGRASVDAGKVPDNLLGRF